jgi:DNA modification methylase
MLGVDKLIPYARNAKKHPPEQVDQIAASIQEWGFTIPVLVDDDGMIIAGHGRVLAAKKLGIDQIPTLTARGWSDEKKRAYVLADNKLTENGGWDEEALANEISDLLAAGFDVGLTGFSGSEIDDLLGDGSQEGLIEDDETPEVEEKLVSKLGDVWQIGKHRVVCGDSTSTEVLDKLLGSEEVDAVWTDPPYNIDYDGGGKRKKIENDNMSGEDFGKFLDAIYSAFVPRMKPGRPFYVAHSDLETARFRQCAIDAGLLVKQCLIWVKPNFTLGRQDYQWQHEPILYGWKPGKAHVWYGQYDKGTVIDDDVPLSKIGKPELMRIVQELTNERKTTIIRCDKPSRSVEHPTMKPVRLIERMLRNSTREGDIVLDVFGGSGSTMVAAHKLNRYARLVELDPGYVDVIVRRMQLFSGEQAKRVGDGKLFDDIIPK